MSESTRQDHPMPGPGKSSGDGADRSDPDQPGADDASSQTDYAYGEDPNQDFVDRDAIDFDPEDGLYTGTVVDGSTSIDGPHIGEDGLVSEDDEKQFLEEGKKQAQEQGLLDEQGNVADAKSQSPAGSSGYDGESDDS